MQTKSNNILAKYAEKFMQKKAKWIDSTIMSALPKWKVAVLRIFPSGKLAKIIGVNIVIADYGTRVEIKLNGKLIGKRSFK